MADPAQVSTEDCNDRPDRIEHGHNQSPPDQRRRRRVDSQEIIGFGGQFNSHTRDPYPPQLDLGEEPQQNDSDVTCEGDEFGSQQQHLLRNSRRRTAHQGSSSGSTGARLNNILATQPFLYESDLEQFWRHRNNERSRSQGTESSDQHTEGSSVYVSAHACTTLSISETSQIDSQEDFRDSRESSSRYFTPSNHTPSHRSVGTVEGEDGSHDNLPYATSSSPYSTYSTERYTDMNEGGPRYYGHC